jgi:pimeloyl-ACP methyl ester carboxylesterase
MLDSVGVTWFDCESGMAKQSSKGLHGDSRRAGALIALLILIAGGCEAHQIPDNADRAVLLIAGAAGDLPGYHAIAEGLKDGGLDVPVRIWTWGAPPPLFAMNLQTQSIHAAAEEELAKIIADWLDSHPAGSLILIGHSAGCGMLLGALGRLPPEAMVESVVLLAPSVSPGYELSPALVHVRQRMHVVYSDRDTFWLAWRTGTFGTYDNVRTPAAGNSGFANVERLPPDLRVRLVQHPYGPAWNSLGNDGGHFGALSNRFAADVIAPMIEDGPS